MSVICIHIQSEEEQVIKKSNQKTIPKAPEAIYKTILKTTSIISV